MRKAKHPTYQKVQAYLDKYPKATLGEALTRTKSGASTFYNQRKAALAAAGKPKRKYEKLTAQEPVRLSRGGEQKFVLIVTAEQFQRISEVL